MSKRVKEGHNGLFRIRLNKDKTKHSIVFVFSKCKEAKKWESGLLDPVAIFIFFRERTSIFSLNFKRSDRRQSSGQEGKLLYSERVSRGYRI